MSICGSSQLVFHPPRPGTHRTLVATRNRRQNYPRLSLEPLGTTINQRLHRIRILGIHHLHQRRVDPPPRLDRIQSTDDQLELLVICLVVVLDLAVVRCHFDAGDAVHDECGGDDGFGFSDVGFAAGRSAVMMKEMKGRTEIETACSSWRCR
jgi:hypothetical protein